MILGNDHCQPILLSLYSLLSHYSLISHPYSISSLLNSPTNKFSYQQILLPMVEFSHVRNPLLAQVYEQYSFNVIPKIGGLVAGDSASYQVGEVMLVVKTIDT